MDLGLKGRAAFVAAASKGLGRACAFALAREGASVAICARNEKALRETADAIAAETRARVIPIVADVSSKAAIDHAIAETVDKLGALHVLIANGGGPPAGAFEELDEETWSRAIDSTLMSTVRLIGAALPHLKHAGWGRVIVVTSSSTREPISGLLLSNTLRPAIVGLCKTLSKELGRYGITVNNVGPGSFDTERIASLHAIQAKGAGVGVEDIRKRAEAAIPLGRIGDPEEYGRVVAFLAGNAASYVSGQTLLVDGGKGAAY